jgi:hypothetical protein
VNSIADNGSVFANNSLWRSAALIGPPRLTDAVLTL